MGIATYSYNRSTSGGEIIRELVNASDGQGLHFANGAALLLAYASGGVFGTADFSIEFILDQDSDNSTDNEIYTSQISGSNVLKVTNSISSNVVRISFDSTNYDIAYDMSGDYGTPTHYVLTCDRSALATLYKNGNSVGTIDISGSSAVNLGNGNTANGYLGGVSGYGAIGSYYRWRTWKKLLSSAEVTACYENASVPIADQWSNCVTDLDLAFANPERSLAVRSKSGVGNATASVGCFQLNPIEQLNSKSARIGTSAATPADGELVVSGKVGVGASPEYLIESRANVAGTTPLIVARNQSASGDATIGFQTNVSPYTWCIGTDASDGAKLKIAQGFDVGTNTALTISSAGLVTASNGIVETNGVLKENLLTNSGFDVWSNSTLENVGSQVTVSDVTSGVCTTSETEGLAVGKLFKFNAGDFNGEVFEITALTNDTSFTLNDTSKTDSGTPGTGYEVTPGCVAANDLAMDGWKKDSANLTLERYHWDGGSAGAVGDSKDGSFYTAKMVSTAAKVMYWNTMTGSDLDWLARWRGRTVTLGAWVKSSVAAKGSITVYSNSVSSTSTTTGTGWEWLETTYAIPASATNVLFWIKSDTATTFVSQPMLVYGSSIGSGNYSRPSGEIVWFESSVMANNGNNATVSSATTYTATAESNGAIPKGAKQIYCQLEGVCATANKVIHSSNAPSQQLEVRSQVSNVWNNSSGFLPVETAGTFGFNRDDTFSIYLQFKGVQLR